MTVLPRSLLVTASAVILSLPNIVFGLPTGLQNVLDNTHRSQEYGYPTDFTRGIVPIPVHSHNDYWRDVPFYTALSQGCISTEADVWLYNGTLYVSTKSSSDRCLPSNIERVGHDTSSLTEERTLESLYINPILDVLKRQNPRSRFVTSPTHNGVFDTSVSQTLYLFIDAKTNGHETFKAVIDALEPLREHGYLTALKNNKTITNGPITVIGTGNTPYDMVAPVANRDYFFDAHLESLNEPENAGITDLISPIASTSFADAIGPVSEGDSEAILTEKQLSTLRSQIATAKERGIGARYWETPSYPIRTRNAVWRALLKEGVALLNADDLEAAASYF
ncbi:hypothetical protein IFM58399_06625 [Aspergillus lentulus]|uniref:Altered inheritance of mitochondria protein 6 n=1 Tax=Aspergillus lentulus TaxID=293939 RepID=A0ABQ0ZV75_ASPLE|nr:uncharacterized protein IFM58399_06625 [Aspergillus lentulus]GFF42467.1 hypothetical protein IFM58399_06625 [Aspergillus lentulus]GFF46724.1 hypothetical protein IFM62136_00590 [Aspergillus lentulus]GFF63369.1 hypothetical protein IFM47457_00341 [Aspergillus lentulus]GFF65832.1 hypothetical protein IFM60648_01723 [Aspergillus lentulus]